MDSASSLTDSAEYGTVRTFSGDLISEGQRHAHFLRLRQRRQTGLFSCVFADLRLALRVVSGSHFVTGHNHPLIVCFMSLAGRSRVRHLSTKNPEIPDGMIHPVPGTVLKIRGTP